MKKLVVVLLMLTSLTSYASWNREGIKRSCIIFFESWRGPSSRPPTALSEHPLFIGELNFLNTFKYWSVRYGKTWYGYRLSPLSLFKRSENVSVTVDLSTQTIGFWLKNPSNIDPMISNVRRIVWAILQNNMNSEEAPSAKVSGPDWVSVSRMPINEKAFNFGRTLIGVLEDKAFDVPLSGLNHEEHLFLQNWFIRFDQTDTARQYLIKISDIAAAE